MRTKTHKGYTIESVGFSYHIWNNFVAVWTAPDGINRPEGPHGYAQSIKSAKVWINQDIENGASK